MTKVTISETYSVGCAVCMEQLQRLCRWSCHDSQVTGLTFKAVPRCEHALPAAPMKKALPPVAEMKAMEPPALRPSPPSPPPPQQQGASSAEGVPSLPPAELPLFVKTGYEI